MANATLDHIEKTLSESYRKEVDQEENVWRSLPFFATTIALQLAALSQLLGHLPSAHSPFWWIAVGSSAVTVTLLILALILIVLCIFPAKFRYLSKDAELLDYTYNLIKFEAEVGQPKFDSLETLKRELAHQYSVATDNNRKINKSRELRRVLAGLLIMASMVSTIVLLATLLNFVYTRNQPNSGEANVCDQQHGPAEGRGQGNDRSVRPFAFPARDAGSHQIMVANRCSV